MIRMDGWLRAMEHLPEGVRLAEVNAERIRCTDLTVKNGEAISSSSFDQTRYYVRAGSESLGMVYTERGEGEESLLLKAASDQARLVSGKTPPLLRDADVFRDMDMAGEESIRDMLDCGARAEKAMEGLQIRQLHVRVTRRESRTLNSRGLDAASGRSWAELSAVAALPRSGMQDAEAENGVSARSLSGLDPEAFGGKIRRLCDLTDGHGLRPVTVPGGSHDCVMTGQVLRNILMTAWRSLSAEAMQGGSSCFRPGERIGSRAVEILNAPSHPLSGKSWPVDSEGTRVERTVLVREGILREPMYTLSSGAKDGKESNGCAGRIPVMTGNVPIAVTTVPGFVYLRPDERESLEGLVARMGTGIVLTYSLDLFHSVNVASGLFSVPCGGFYVRNGEAVGSVSQMTVAGHLRELFGAVEAVADDLDFDDFYFRNYCVGSPSALLRGLRFAT